MPALSRRSFLTGALAAAGATAASSVLPPALQKALAAEPPAHPGLEQIEHVVVFMQENRSFDTYFGSLSGVRGFDDPQAGTLPTGRSVFHQPDALNPDGYELPFHLDTHRTSGAAVADLSHAWSAQHASWAGGANDGWLAAHRAADGQVNGPMTMGYYTRSDLPFHYALADAFTICDMSFCSVMGPTNPNRLYLWTGTVDADGKAGGPVTDNDESVPFRWTTYPERLQAAGVSWRVYQESDNYDDNALAWFAQYQQAPTTSPLYRNGLAVRSATAFEDDVRNDDLPQVSWIIAPSVESEHPSYLPAAGADLTARYLQALASNPKVWRKTAFFLTYDENDGFFDHVTPPTPPLGTPGEFVGGLPIGLGFRVPTIVISPFTTGGWVCSDVFDHTSFIRFMEARFGVEEPNISAWRRRTCGDLTSAFDFRQPVRSFPSLPDTTAYLAQQRASTSLPAPTVPAVQTMPHQEPGTRPHRPAARHGASRGASRGAQVPVTG